MWCPHCNVEFQDNKEVIPIGEDIEGKYEIKKTKCTNCNRLVLHLTQYRQDTIAVGETSRNIRNFQNEILIRPQITLHGPVSWEQSEKVICCFCGESLMYKSALKISIELPGDRKEFQGWFAHANCFDKLIHPGIPKHDDSFH